jgi:hypothetical protein
MVDEVKDDATEPAAEGAQAPEEQPAAAGEPAAEEKAE